VLVAVGGVFALLWSLLAGVFGLGLVSFATGSMSPTFPMGSVALSQSVPIRSVQVGDVVTVDRGPSMMPITHRVVSIRLDRDGGQALVHLQGDANTDPDPVTYRVAQLRRIVLPLPGLAKWLGLGTSPLGVGLVAMLISGAVLWALWPTERADGRR
jgi:signal peptidase